MAWPLDAEGMGHKKVLCFCFSAFFVLICFSLPLPTSGDIATDREALLAFKKSTGDNRNLASWNTSSNSSICTNWTGITCSHVSASQRVTELQLSNRSLSGQIPLSTLGKLDALETLTLSSNHFSGELPLDLTNCTSLKNISLQNNNFSGPLAASAFSTWPHLLQIDLSFNNFSGSIPQSITNATSLQSLNFENNSFSGTIPDITASSLKAFNVANNELEGQIPTSLSKFSNGSFAGNKELCGEPLNATCASSPSPSPYPTSNSSSISRSPRAGLSDGAIVGIVIGTVLGGCLLLVLFGFVASNHKGTKVHVGSNQKPRETGEAQVVEVPHVVEEEGLVFVNNINNEAFDMDSLLRASAEVMGKGTLGMAYKAMLEDGLVLVVKRLYFEYREDYKRRLLVLASLKHPNLIPFKAWYFSKDEKFLVYDYMRHGSLHAYLFGEIPMDWERRLSVAGTVAKALAYIHAQQVVHGDLKSTNVMLNADGEACIIDYGQVTVAVRITGKNTGYNPPEVTDLSKMTIKGDVYSFGVLLLELLTGRSPLPAAGNRAALDLPNWVKSVVREQWTAEVFDLEIMKFEYIQEEMMELLQLALRCVSLSPDERPSMADLSTSIENLRSSDSEEDSR